jgi:predicted aspartyl protease
LTMTKGLSLRVALAILLWPAMALAADNRAAQPPAATPPTIPSPPAAPIEDIVGTAVDDSLRLTVPVMINGKGPFDFVIDTGADRTVISQELATRLGLPESGTAQLHSLGGSRKVSMVDIDSVKVSTNVIRKVRAAALPARNLGADGLLGIDALKGQRIVIDFAAKTMKVVPSAEPEEPAPENTSLIIVTARSRLGQLVMVDADANGKKIWVVVDTGAQNSIANSRLRSLLTKGARGAEVKSIEMLDVLGNRTPADYVVVSKLRIGGVGLGQAPVAFADAHPFKLFGLSRKPAMLLGIETLRVFRRVSVDFATREVKFLLPNEP